MLDVDSDQAARRLADHTVRHERGLRAGRVRALAAVLRRWLGVAVFAPGGALARAGWIHLHPRALSWILVRSEG
jgi:hypothetical protein